MLESPLNRLAGFKISNFHKKRLQHRYFFVNIAKFLRALIMMKICEQLPLPFLLLTALKVLFKVYRVLLEFYLVVGSSLIWKKGKLAEIVTSCHSLSFVVPLVVTSCHSLSLVVPVVVACCHSLSLVCLFVNDLVITTERKSELKQFSRKYLFARTV